MSSATPASVCSGLPGTVDCTGTGTTGATGAVAGVGTKGSWPLLLGMGIMGGWKLTMGGRTSGRALRTEGSMSLPSSGGTGLRGEREGKEEKLREKRMKKCNWKKKERTKKYNHIYRNSLFSPSKFSCKKFPCKIIFVKIELNENFLQHVYTSYNCIRENNFRAFSAHENILTTKIKQITVVSSYNACTIGMHVCMVHVHACASAT